jgi:Leucine-rich repeat (LRR) protein
VLDQNRLEGTISAILEIKGLKYLDLSRNKFSSGFNRGIRELKELSVLYVKCFNDRDLSENELSGFIPAEIGELGKLAKLSLNKNRLTGEIPREIQNLKNLTYL